MTLLKAAAAVLGFAIGPFLFLGFMNSGTMLGAFCGIGVLAVYSITFMCAVAIVADAISK
jgi:hypothetical protein